MSQISFNDQKYQSRLQKHTLTAHFYLCLVASYIFSPCTKVLDFLRQYAPSNEPAVGEAYGVMRPFYAPVAIWIHSLPSLVWNVLMRPFRYLNNHFDRSASVK